MGHSYSSLEKRLMLARRDVDRVIEAAAIVFCINKEGDLDWMRENEDPRLNVIAVVGPAHVADMDLELALLAEVGIGRQRPFAEGSRFSAGRRRYFSLTRAQALGVAPHVFAAVDYFTRMKTSGWKRKTYSFRAARSRYLKSAKKTIVTEGVYAYRRGIRFSFDLRDEEWVKDLYWAQFFVNHEVRKYLGGLSRFIDKRLDNYRRTRRRRRSSASKLRPSRPFPFERTVGAIEVAAKLRAVPHKYYPRYLLIEMLIQLLPGGRKNVFFDFLAKVISWNGETLSKENLAAKTVARGVAGRIDGLQVRMIRRNSRYLVVEVSSTD